MRKQFLEIGKIVATQGLGGEVRVQYYCDSADVICSFDRLFLGKDKQELEVEKARPHKTLAVLKLGGIDNVDEAKTIVGKMPAKARHFAGCPISGEERSDRDEK